MNDRNEKSYLHADKGEISLKLEQVIEFMPESIRAKISRRTFRPGEFVVRKGERADHVYILTKGTTRVSNEFASGQRYTFAHQTVPDSSATLRSSPDRSIFRPPMKL